VLRHSLPVHQGNAPAKGTGGEVLGQLEAHRRVGDDALGCDQLLDLAANVGDVPRRPAGGQSAQYPVDETLSVQRAHRGRDQVHGSLGIAIAEGVEFGQPAGR
jgi:hypothetical protein